MKADEKFFKSSVAIIHRTYSEMYNLVLRKNANPKMVLREYQQAVAQVHRWTVSKQKVEFEKALRFEPKYERLIGLNMRTSVKSVIPADRVKYAMEEVPDPAAFFHMCLVEVSRDMYRYPSLMYHNVDTFTRRKNREQIKELIHAALDKVLLDIIPVLSDSDESEPEEDPDDASNASTRDVDEREGSPLGGGGDPYPTCEAASDPEPTGEVASDPDPRGEVASDPYPTDPDPTCEVASDPDPRGEVASDPYPTDPEPTCEVASDPEPTCEAASDLDPTGEAASDLDPTGEAASDLDPTGEAASDPSDMIVESFDRAPPSIGEVASEASDPSEIIEDNNDRNELFCETLERSTQDPDHITIDIRDAVLKKKNPRLTSLALSLVSPARDTVRSRIRNAPSVIEAFTDSDSERDISVKTSLYSDDLDEDPIEDAVTSDDEEAGSSTKRAAEVMESDDIVFPNEDPDVFSSDNEEVGHQ